MASKGHLGGRQAVHGAEQRSPDFLTQIPQPMHRNSEMKAILSVDLTSMQSFPGVGVIHRRPPAHARERLTHFDDGT
ncbi:hypothetical protein FB451DRAFT_1021289 [Mycena latifolia]|nr:hypothetical protein FB451DRAFT_1021289 [Mycena latifolia]